MRAQKIGLVLPKENCHIHYKRKRCLIFPQRDPFTWSIRKQSLPRRDIDNARGQVHRSHPRLVRYIPHRVSRNSQPCLTLSPSTQARSEKSLRGMSRIQLEFHHHQKGIYIYVTLPPDRNPSHEIDPGFDRRRETSLGLSSFASAAKRIEKCLCVGGLWRECPGELLMVRLSG